MLVRPGIECRALELGTVVENDPCRVAAFDGDLVQRPHDPLRRQARVDFARQSLATQDVEHVQDPEPTPTAQRSEEHTSELQSHSFISYAVFCLKKTNTQSPRPSSGLALTGCAEETWRVLT